MNQEKIGNFISELRKEKNMTQEQLAQKLKVTDKAVSKWENGRCMPDISLLKPLCDELEITVNELLIGSKVSKEDYNKIADENLIRIIEKQNNSSEIFEKRMMLVLVITAIITIIIINLLSIESLKDLFILIMVIALAFISNTLNIVAVALKKDNMNFSKQKRNFKNK